MAVLVAHLFGSWCDMQPLLTSVHAHCRGHTHLQPGNAQASVSSPGHHSYARSSSAEHSPGIRSFSSNITSDHTLDLASDPIHESQPDTTNASSTSANDGSIKTPDHLTDYSLDHSMNHRFTPECQPSSKPLDNISDRTSKPGPNVQTSKLDSQSSDSSSHLFKAYTYTSSTNNNCSTLDSKSSHHHHRRHIDVIEDCAESFCGFENVGDPASDLSLFR